MVFGRNGTHYNGMVQYLLSWPPNQDKYHRGENVVCTCYYSTYQAEPLWREHRLQLSHKVAINDKDTPTKEHTTYWIDVDEVLTQTQNQKIASHHLVVHSHFPSGSLLGLDNLLDLSRILVHSLLKYTCHHH
ncbi:hypothetical protein FOCC_FOCC008802 [Frankliniella occidentalis]|nr:hypothetical protein FOCC_FOCC008802 [Frankliniella occidentalis]